MTGIERTGMDSDSLFQNGTNGSHKSANAIRYGTNLDCACYTEDFPPGAVRFTKESDMGETGVVRGVDLADSDVATITRHNEIDVQPDNQWAVDLHSSLGSYPAGSRSLIAALSDASVVAFERTAFPPIIDRCCDIRTCWNDNYDRVPSMLFSVYLKWHTAGFFPAKVSQDVSLVIPERLQLFARRMPSATVTFLFSADTRARDGNAVLCVKLGSFALYAPREMDAFGVTVSLRHASKVDVTIPPGTTVLGGWLKIQPVASRNSSVDILRMSIASPLVSLSNVDPGTDMVTSVRGCKVPQYSVYAKRRHGFALMVDAAHLYKSGSIVVDAHLPVSFQVSLVGFGVPMCVAVSRRAVDELDGHGGYMCVMHPEADDVGGKLLLVKSAGAGVVSTYAAAVVTCGFCPGSCEVPAFSGRFRLQDVP